MEFYSRFFSVFVSYVQALWWPVVFGFLLSGLFYEFIPTKTVEKYFGRKGLAPILMSTVVGTALPICCFGTLPLAVTMKNKGACPGPVLAFLVATPATSASALLISWRLMGPGFTVYIAFAVIVMGVVIGMLGNLVPMPAKTAAQNTPHPDCCHEGGARAEAGNFFQRLERVFVYAVVTLPREIGLALLLGLLVASFVIVFQPAHTIIQTYLQGLVGYFLSLAVGLGTYVCSTGSVPMVDAFIKSGMPYGPAMVYLLAGPIASYGIIFAVKKEFGMKLLGVYLAVVCSLSLISGMFFNFLVTGSVF